MNILVLQPTRPSNPPKLRERAAHLLERMVAACPQYAFDIHQDDTALEIPAHPSLYMRHATVRNHMLDTHLCPSHTHVLWIDSDLIDYPAELPMKLLEACDWCPECCKEGAIHRFTYPPKGARECGICGAEWGGTIAAPMAVLDTTSLTQKNRFYDIGGFIENGNRARMYPPWFEQEGDVIELDSVGCCYLVSAELYHEGVRYRPPPTDYYVEHWSVMQAAKRRGYRIVALRNVVVTHAWLPDYGVRPN